MTDESQTAPAGLIPGLSAFLRSAWQLLGSRAALAVLELADARDALLSVLLLGAGAFFIAGLALLCLTAMIVALSWDSLGWRILLILTLIYAALAALLVLRLRRIFAEGRLGLPLTLAELKKDGDALRSHSDP